MPAFRTILEGRGILFNKGRPYEPTEVDDLPKQQRILPGRIPVTGPYYDHITVRPEYYLGNRHFYEPIDNPGWRKHPLVAGEIDSSKNPFGRYSSWFEGLYDFDSQAHEEENLDGENLIATLRLLCLGLEGVDVAKQAGVVSLGSGTYEREPGVRKSRWEPRLLSPVDHKLTIVPMFFENEENPNGPAHWTLLIWDQRCRELYHFDAYSNARAQRFKEAVYAWDELLGLKKDRNSFLAFEVEQYPQTIWECGYFVAMNAARFLRMGAGRKMTVTTEGRTYTGHHRVSSWGRAHWGGRPQIPETEALAAAQEGLTMLRADIYSVFGCPLNVPLNPYRPLVERLDFKVTKQGVESGRWLWRGDLLRAPDFSSTNQLLRDTRARSHKAHQLIEDCKKRDAKGAMIWQASKVRPFWYSTTASLEEKFKLGSWQNVHNHDPYAKEIRNRNEPFAPLFATVGIVRPNSAQRASADNAGWKAPTGFPRSSSAGNLKYQLVSARKKPSQERLDVDRPQTPSGPKTSQPSHRRVLSSSIIDQQVPGPPDFSRFSNPRSLTSGQRQIAKRWDAREGRSPTVSPPQISPHGQDSPTTSPPPIVPRSRQGSVAQSSRQASPTPRSRQSSVASSSHGGAPIFFDDGPYPSIDEALAASDSRRSRETSSGLSSLKSIESPDHDQSLAVEEDTVKMTDILEGLELDQGRGCGRGRGQAQGRGRGRGRGRVAPTATSQRPKRSTAHQGLAPFDTTFRVPDWMGAYEITEQTNYSGSRHFATRTSNVYAEVVFDRILEYARARQAYFHEREVRGMD